MIKEYAFGINKRHHFHEPNKYIDFRGLKTDTYYSLFNYDRSVIEYFSQNKTLSGFDGMIYMPDDFILDVDGPKFDIALEKAQKLSVLLDQYDCHHTIFFSGRGFHFTLPEKAFKWKPSKNLHNSLKKVLTNMNIFKFADPSVTDKTRLIRIVNTRNTKSGYYKVDLEKEWIFHLNAEELILNHASKPREPRHRYVVNAHKTVFDLNKEDIELPIEIPEIQSFNSSVYKPDPANYTCIQRMLTGTSIGERHATALRIAAHFRWLYPEPVVRLVMESWRQKVDRPDYRFSEKEMDNIIKSTYEGHNGDGNRYGCNDPIMDKHCSTSCKLYKFKADTRTLDSTSMENELIEFYKSDIKPVDIGALYGTTFPIYPGEVIILQAPPASMKTMLLQNWMVALKRETYFVEMEMSARQIWSRFVMIENKWSEKQLKEHYKTLKNGMDQKFKWLTVDYSSPFPFELEKRIQMLPKKPEIVVVDHIGLLRSKHKDMNMKLEEASQSLMELAVKHKIIVFAVSEINKSSFKEGMDISSSRGSFRIAYNANKLLSLKPYRSEDGTINFLGLKSDKNREREHINVKLMIKNVNILKCEEA